jgi:hypothetical protein
MKRIAIIVLVVVGLAVMLTGCGKKEETKDTWVEFTSKEGRFSVLMPKQPTVRKQTAPGSVEVHMFLVEYTAVAYGVLYNDLAGKVTDPEKALDDGRAGAVRSSGGVLLTEKKISLDGYPGREIRIKTRDNIIYTARIYVVGQRFYQIIVTTPEGMDISKPMKKFMDSFKLI